MTTNVTIQEFSKVDLVALGDVRYPADKKTTHDVTTPFTLQENTAYVVITADADCRCSFDGVAPVSSDVPILAAVPNPFLLVHGQGRILRFL